MNSPRPRPLSRLLLVLAAVAVTVLGLVAPASAAAPYCGLTWGSQPKSAGDLGPAGSFVTNVRAGQHACYDRLVVDLGEAGGFNDYDVRYVPQLLADGSGQFIPLRGGAVLAVVVHVPAYDENGDATYSPANSREVVPTTGYRTFRQVAWAGSFEGYTTLGIGTRARLPFRVLVLLGPPGSGQDMKLVVDVAHRW
jgi:hypothetical protein